MDRASAATTTAIPDAGPRTEWLVDGYNVLQVTLLGGEDRSDWWREPARARLLERVSGLPPDRGRVWVVFDGPDPLPEPEGEPGPVQVVFAPSADDWIARRARQRRDAPCVVVTADRRLAGRCRHAGARIAAPGDFIGACRGEAVDASD